MYNSTCSDSPPPFERSTIGQYDIIYPLASGGMARIYVGRLSGMAGFEKLVTLKIIHSHLATMRQFVDMFLDEARLVARIHHPNIGEIYEVGEDNGQLFMAAEFVDGSSLRHLLRATRERNTNISHPIAAWICAEVCQGLQIAHNLTDDEGCPLNLVHRDISPSNILLSYNGWVKLIDFGIAFAEKRMTKTVAGNVKGKFGYISPEQLKGAPLDRRADIFAIGVILYELITGRHPFPGKTEAERLRKTLQYEIVTPTELSIAVDAELESILLKAMAELPEDRYQDASSLERDLRRYVALKRQITGASDVARIMQILFADRKTAHQVKLSEFKHNTPIAPRMRRTGENLGSASPTKQAQIDTALSAVSEGPQKGKPEFSIRNFALFAIIGGVVVSLLTAGLIYLLTSKSRAAPPWQSDEMAAIENHMVGREPPTGISKGNNPSGKEENRNTETKEDDAPGASELIDIPVTLRPADTELLLNGDVLEVKENSIRIPGDGRSYSIIARAPDYVTETYAIVAKTGETLSVELSRSSPSPSDHSKNDHKTERRKKHGNKAGRKPTNILKRNPY